MNDAKIAVYPDGIVILGSWPGVKPLIKRWQDIEKQQCPLVIADPPYGNIVKNDWDKYGSAKGLATEQIKQAIALDSLCYDGAALYWFGGYGKVNFRPFYIFMVGLEQHSAWNLSMHITWGKKRAYGVQHNYLSTREEIAYCVLGDIKKPRLFNIPLLAEKRGYADYKQPEKVGYISACYHGTSKNCTCMSPRAQAQSKRDVLALLRQMDLPQGSKSKDKETSQVGSKKQGASTKIHSKLENNKPNKECIIPFKIRSQETRDSIRLDGKGSEKNLDNEMSSLWDRNNSQFKKRIQLSVGRQDRQLCWVCTRKYLHNVLEGKQTQNGCLSGGVGSNNKIHEDKTFEDVTLIKSQVKYPAKSEFKRRTAVWTDITEIFRGKIHVAQKPLDLLKVPIETHTKPGEHVIDPFAGSGTTGVAARELGRKFVLVEKDPENFKLILSRLGNPVMYGDANEQL